MVNMSGGLSWFRSLFLDSTPSMVAAFAIFTTIALFVTALFVSGGSASVGQKVGSSVLLFLVLLPSIGLSLFDITCLMRGGDKDLCAILGWVKALIILLYTGMIAALTIAILYYGKQLKYDGFADAPKKEAKDVDGIFTLTADSPFPIESFVDASGNVVAAPAAKKGAAAPAQKKKVQLAADAAAVPEGKPADVAVRHFVGSADPLSAAVKGAMGLGEFLGATEEKKAEQFFGGSLGPIAHMSDITAGLAPAA